MASSKEKQLSPEEKRLNDKQLQVKHLDIGLLGSSWATEPTSAVGVPRPSGPNPGKHKVVVRLNAFKVESFPKITIYQYDVKVVAYDAGPRGKNVVCEQRPLLRKIWNSKEVQKTVAANWLYDGNKLAWNEVKLAKTIHEVDLDKEQNRTPNASHPDRNKFRFELTPTGQVDFTAIDAYIQGRADRTDAAIAALTILDQMIRHGPSERMTAIKRNFYSKDESRVLNYLPGGITHLQGAYAAVKLVHNGAAPPSPAINVDVSNGTFYQMYQVGKNGSRIVLTVDMLLLEISGIRTQHQLQEELVANSPRAVNAARKIKRMRVTTNHSGTVREYIVDGLVYRDPKRQQNPVNASKWEVTTKNSNGQVEKKNLVKFFKDRYSKSLKHPGLPLLLMAGSPKDDPDRWTVIPMELCTPSVNARYPYKLNDVQTMKMIDWTVRPPQERWRNISTQVDALGYQNDALLKHYQLRISTQPSEVTSTVLEAPVVQFAGGQAKPGTSGRWNLKGQRFHTPAPKPLTQWSVTVLDPSLGPHEVDNFISVLVRQMRVHGMKVANDTPKKEKLPLNTHPEAVVRKGFQLSGYPPDLLIFILPSKDASLYNALKHFSEIGTQMSTTAIGAAPSQILQGFKAKKAQDQYCSNVAMKINAKLGGFTCIAAGPPNKRVVPEGPTMFIGCDVSHPAPGAKSQSIAAFTVSWDRNFVKYRAVVASNGDRKEMVNSDVIGNQLGALIKKWCTEVGGGSTPLNVFYMRDGVSEGQYSQVVEQEVGPIRNVFSKLGKRAPKITAMICSKRHHVRFFPKDARQGDQNGNPLPGSLVESGVTDPRDWDFYLCAHAAIKGTARPVHYFVLCDEVKMPPASLQQMVYQHSYQYVRATVPVSLHPAIYYSHLAAARAAAHTQKAYLQFFRKEGGQSQAGGTNSSSELEPGLATARPQILETMWYV